MSKKSEFPKHSASPFGSGVSEVNGVYLYGMSIKTLKVYVMVVDSHENGVVELNVEKFAAYYKIGQEDLTEARKKLLRAELWKGMVDLLDRGVLARSYKKNLYWVNLEKIW